MNKLISFRIYKNYPQFFFEHPDKLTISFEAFLIESTMSQLQRKEKGRMELFFPKKLLRQN